MQIAFGVAHQAAGAAFLQPVQEPGTNMCQTAWASTVSLEHMKTHRAGWLWEQPALDKLAM